MSALAAIALPDAELAYDEALFDARQASALFECLLEDTVWEQHVVRIHGRAIDCPRLSAWYGDPGARYRYSGLSLDPLPWSECIAAVREQVEAATGARFNSVLLNLYRSGADSMGWHADDEPELGPEPVIASVSLGAGRRFVMQHRRRRDVERFELVPAHGSLLLMQGPTQRNWRHAVPRTRRPVASRINLTFRLIRP